MHFWWNQYIGIPFVDGGAGPSGCDCWGLVRLIYRQEFGIDLPGVVYETMPEAKSIQAALELTRDAFWEPVDMPRAGDVLSLRVAGHESHVGIVTTPGHMLHMPEHEDSVIEPYTSRRWKERVIGIYRYAGERKAEAARPEHGVMVTGKPHPLKARISVVVGTGRSLGDIINSLCDEADVPPRFRQRGHAYVNLKYIPYERWDSVFPADRDAVFFAMSPGKGGGIGAILGVVLVVAAAALTWWAGGAGGYAAAAAMAGWSYGAYVAGYAGLMVLSLGLAMTGMYLMNNSIQAKAPKGDSLNQQDIKFLSGGSNALRPFGVIPQVLGIGRMKLDYLAKYYTERADQYINYLRACYTAGYGETEISDIRNGDTPLSRYVDMQYNVYSGKGGDQTPKIFTRDVDEQSVGVTLTKGTHNYCQTGPNVDSVQIVLHWPQGLWYRNSKGEKGGQRSAGYIRWRALPSGQWNDAHVAIAPASFALPPCNPAIDVELIYDEQGNLDPEDWWLQTYGVPKKLQGQDVEMELYRWYTFALRTGTNQIVKYEGTTTDSKNGEPSARLLKLMTEGKWLWNAAGFTGRLVPPGENEELLAYVCVKGDSIIEVQDKRDSVSVEGCAPSASGLTVSFSAGGKLNAGLTSWDFSYSNQTRAFTRQYSFNLPRGQYEFDVVQTSADDAAKANWKGQAAVQIQWVALRAFTNGTPFNPRKALAWLELRVKATDSLSGALDMINAAVKSVVLDYDYKTKTWVRRVSSNPASLFRHVLQGPAIPDSVRVPDSGLDIPMLERWHNYCRTQGFTYFKVVGGDSGMDVYSLLTEIAAAGWAKPLLRAEDGGVWSVLMDEPKTQIMQHFAEHNTWDWQWQRQLIDVPHAIRATFVDKAKGYEQNTVTVYMDGYSAANAKKYENWGVEYFEGVTEIKNVQRICRRAIAFALLRSEHPSFMVSQEHIRSSVGDLVSCTNAFIGWGLGSGWIAGLVMSGKSMTGLKLSESVTLESGKDYSIRVRRAGARGASVKFDVARVSVATQTDEITLTAPATANLPAEGDLYQFGYMSRETHLCVIEAIKPEAGGTARITVCDYAPELFAIDEGAIPPHNADISEPAPLPSAYVASVPTLLEGYSDERALLVAADGSLTCRLAVAWKNPPKLEKAVTHVQLRMARKVTAGVHEDADQGASLPGYEEWETLPPLPLSEGTAYCQPVEEKGFYNVDGRYVTAGGVVGPWATLLREHKVVGKTSPPPDVTNFRAAIRDASGITLAWDAVTVPDLSHYVVGGAAQGRTPATTLLVQVRGKVGTLPFTCVAVDTSGNMSATPAEASVVVKAPLAPVLTARVTSAGLELSWKDCAATWPIAHYVVTDVDSGDVQQLKATSLPMPPREAGEYEYTARAVDVFDNAGPLSRKVFSVKAPDAPKPAIRIDGADMVIYWPAVTSSFPIDFYEIVDVYGAPIAKTKSTQHRFPAPAVGTVEFRLRAVDVAGNASPWAEVAFTTTAPEPPRVSATVSAGHDGISVSWKSGGSLLPIAAWDLVRQWVVDLGGGIMETREQDYGRLDVDTLAVAAVTAGEHFFMVRAVDSAGNVSGWGEASFMVHRPGKSLFYDCGTIDNNVLLYWTPPDFVFFAVAYYVFSEVDADGYEMEIGRIDALFASSFEAKSGQYTYRVTPVDVAGNAGIPAEITMRVDQPPDFVFYHDYDSLFNGQREHLALDGRGSMFGPVAEDETWQENADRVGALLGVAGDDLTWQQKVDAGLDYYMSPELADARYVEVVDVGTRVPSTKISVTMTRNVLAGNPAVRCMIESSPDGVDWTLLTDNGFSVYATSFQFVRYTFVISGGLLEVKNINYSLNIKRKTDFGTAQCKATDNGPGWPADEDQAGTEIFFNADFMDINGAPQAQVLHQSADNPLRPLVSFKDILNPKSFRVAVFDKDGKRADADVSWQAYGV